MGEKKYSNFQGIKNLYIGWTFYILKCLNLDSMMTYCQ